MAKNKKNHASGSPVKARKAAEGSLRQGDEKRAENRRKNRQMGNLFLYVLLAVIGTICLISLVKTLFFPSKSLGDLAGNYRFISVVAIPYLIMAAAVIARALLKKRFEGFSASARKAAGLLFVLVLAAGAILFGSQVLTGRTKPEQEPVYTKVTQALRDGGYPVTPEEDAAGFRSLLESDSMDVFLYNDSTAVMLRYHRGGALLAARFLDQAGRDYAGFEKQIETRDGLTYTIWSRSAENDSGVKALAVRSRDAILIFELVGADSDTARLLEILEEAAPAALKAADR